jgi:preprotein translocase subunit SecD
MTRFTATLILVGMCLSSGLATADDKPKDKPSVKVEFRRAEKEAAEGLTEATVEGSKDKVYLHKTAELTNDDIAEAKASEDANKHPSVSITLTKDGAAKMKKLTEEHRDKPLAILVDGKVISALIIKAVISHGKAEITGIFSEEEVEKLAKSIKGK